MYIVAEPIFSADAVPTHLDFADTERSAVLQVIDDNDTERTVCPMVPIAEVADARELEREATAARLLAVRATLDLRHECLRAAVNRAFFAALEDG